MASARTAVTQFGTDKGRQSLRVVSNIRLFMIRQRVTDDVTASRLLRWNRKTCLSEEEEKEETEVEKEEAEEDNEPISAI